MSCHGAPKLRNHLDGCLVANLECSPKMREFLGTYLTSDLMSGDMSRGAIAIRGIYLMAKEGAGCSKQWAAA